MLSLTTTFAAIDWGMSLAPHWFSTMYGVLFIVGWTLSALALTVLLMAALAGEEPFARALRPETVSDLGKLLLTFTMLWAYVNFSQFLIIWSGNVSEETPFYLRRLHGGWLAVGVLLLVFHFALPFALLLSRPLKRNARALAGVAGLMLLMRLVDLYWLIGPDLVGHGPEAAPLRVHWMDPAAVPASVACGSSSSPARRARPPCCPWASPRCASSSPRGRRRTDRRPAPTPRDRRVRENGRGGLGHRARRPVHPRGHVPDAAVLVPVYCFLGRREKAAQEPAATVLGPAARGPGARLPAPRHVGAGGARRVPRPGGRAPDELRLGGEGPASRACPSPRP